MPTHNIPFGQPMLDQDEIDAVTKVLKGPILAHGSVCLEFEEAFAKHIGVDHAISVSSGTSGLHLSLFSRQIGPGDEVIVPAMTHVATAHAVEYCSAKPVFVDIRPDTWNIDETLLEAAITDKTKAIMPVSIYGQCPDMDAINEIAKKYNLPVIEDAAQSFGATYKGKQSCNLSTIGSTSFFPSKPLGCYGDGGALFTNDDELAEKFRWIRVHGQERKHHHPILGINGRMDTIQAAILLEILEVFPEEVQKREQLGQTYSTGLAGVEDISTPNVGEYNTSVYAQYTILSEHREQIQLALKVKDIPSVSYYSVPLHLQPVFKNLDHQAGNFAIAEKVANQCLSLPMSPYITQEDQAQIIDIISSKYDPMSTA